MVLDYWSPIRANVSDSEHNQTHARRQPTRVTGCSWCRVLFYDCVCLVVCFNLRPKTAISRGEQNRYGWRRRTLLTTRLIKFYGGLLLMKSTAAYGGLCRRLGALQVKVISSTFCVNLGYRLSVPVNDDVTPYNFNKIDWLTDWLTWKATGDRNSNIVETSERLLRSWHTGYVISTSVVQSTVVRERECAVRVHHWNSSKDVGLTNLQTVLRYTQWCK